MLESQLENLHSFMLANPPSVALLWQKRSSNAHICLNMLKDIVPESGSCKSSG